MPCAQELVEVTVTEKDLEGLRQSFAVAWNCVGVAGFAPLLPARGRASWRLPVKIGQGAKLCDELDDCLFVVPRLTLAAITDPLAKLLADALKYHL